MLHGKNVLVYITFVQVVYVLYVQVVYIYHIEKDMSDDMDQVNNESIDMTHLRKIYMNIAPTGHNNSFTECHKLSYSCCCFPGHWLVQCDQIMKWCCSNLSQGLL